MKSRKHHNNKGTTQLKTGNRAQKTRLLAKKMGVPFEIHSNILFNKTIDCPICTRVTPKEYWHKHHLVPKSKKGKETILLCESCGNMLHQLFTNKELAKQYNNLDAILSHLDIQNWISWVKKKPNDFTICMATKKKRRR